MKILILVLMAAACPAQVMCGDCYPDGVVDVLDVLTVAQVAVGLDPVDATTIGACDVYLPGPRPMGPGRADAVVWDILDALTLALYLVGLEPSLSCAP